MYSIMGMPTAMSKAQTNTFVDQHGLDVRYKGMTLYTDGLGYWFAEKIRSRSRSSTLKSPKVQKVQKVLRIQKVQKFLRIQKVLKRAEQEK